MATVKTGFIKQERWIGFLEESTFGTVQSDGSNYEIMHVNGASIPAFVPDNFTADTMLNRSKNMMDIRDMYKQEGGMFQRYQIPECTGEGDILGAMLYAATQAASEAATTPFLKTYTMNGATDPDFSSDAGYFFTLLVKDPTASHSQKLTSCVMESLTIRISPENGGRITYSGTALTGKGYTNTSNPSGTNAFSTATVPNFHDSNASTLSINSLDLVWKSAEITINNVYDYVGYNSGNAENYKLVSQEVTGNFVVKYDTNSDAFKALKGTDVGTTTLTVGQNSSAGYFSLSAPETWLEDFSIDDPDGQVVDVSLQCKFLIDANATNYVVFEVADAVDRSW